MHLLSTRREIYSRKIFRESVKYPEGIPRGISTARLMRHSAYECKNTSTNKPCTGIANPHLTRSDFQYFGKDTYRADKKEQILVEELAPNHQITYSRERNVKEYAPRKM